MIGGPRSAIIIVSLALLRLHMSVDRIGDGRIGAACFVLVDDRGALAVVAYPRHHQPRLLLQDHRGGLATNDEASDFRWATEAELPGLMDEPYAIRVLDALHDAAGVAVRPHDGVHLL
jgi:hypothetical protein